MHGPLDDARPCRSVEAVDHAPDVWLTAGDPHRIRGAPVRSDVLPSRARAGRNGPTHRIGWACGTDGGSLAHDRHLLPQRGERARSHLELRRPGPLTPAAGTSVPRPNRASLRRRKRSRSASARNDRRPCGQARVQSARSRPRNGRRPDAEHASRNQKFDGIVRRHGERHPPPVPPTGSSSCALACGGPPLDRRETVTTWPSTSPQDGTGTATTPRSNACVPHATASPRLDPTAEAPALDNPRQ